MTLSAPSKNRALEDGEVPPLDVPIHKGRIYITGIVSPEDADGYFEDQQGPVLYTMIWPDEGDEIIYIDAYMKTVRYREHDEYKSDGTGVYPVIEASRTDYGSLDNERVHGKGMNIMRFLDERLDSSRTLFEAVEALYRLTRQWSDYLADKDVNAEIEELDFWERPETD